MRGRAIRVFYNASSVPARPAGAGTYTLQLGRALAGLPGIDLVVASAENRAFGEHLQTPRTTLRRLRWEEFDLWRDRALAASDVYHGPHFFTPGSPVPSVATVHDLTFHRIPARYRVAHRLYYRHLAQTATRADRIIVPSAAVAGDCLRYLGYPGEQIRVIAEAPRAGLAPSSDAEIERFAASQGVRLPYFACVGTAEPGKRLVDAIRAMSAIRQVRPDVSLVVAGNTGPLSVSLERETARLGLTASVRFLGYIPDHDLAPLLTGATALIFPSLYEGFGLPPIEAMACGTPVITTQTPAMSEVLRHGATFVPLRDPAAIARRALEMLNSQGLRDERSKAAVEFAAGFSWHKAAVETASVYQELVR